jgi:crotonobetainyl-CoA:carnitine CoA-transferase CaiB-like acyl-CoA transferase
MTSIGAVLSGLKIVDFGVGMADALVSKFLVELGATVHRVEPPEGDPFGDIYPAYEYWRRGQLLDVEASRSLERQSALLADADVCIVGGEDFPGHSTRHDSSDLSSRYPRLVVLHISADGGVFGHSRLPAVDILVQARSGIVFELAQNEPMSMSFQPANYGVAIQALAGLGASLFEREGSGKGQIVSVSMVEGALSWVQCCWAEAETPTAAFEFAAPKDAQPLICRCRDGVYIHIVLGALGSKARLYKVLGIDDPSVTENDSGLPSLKGGTKNYYGDVELVQKFTAERDSVELLSALRSANVVVEAALAPGECWGALQVRANRILASGPSGEEFVGNPGIWRVFPTVGEDQRCSETLNQIRVVDFGAFVAGPIASLALADLGADVVKIEPLGGDPLRPAYKFYAACNRGKRVISIDLKSGEGIELARRICSRADIVCSNFRVGVAGRLGIDAAGIHQSRPQCIVLHNAGYGIDGPEALSPAFDPVMQAMCGHEYRMGGVGNAPKLNRCMPVDIAGGLLGSVLMLFALYRRARSGEGADLTVSLLNAGVYLMSELVRQADGRFVGASPLSSDRRGFHPAEHIYRTRDGWMALAARSTKMRRALAHTLGIEAGLGRDPAAWSDEESAVIASALAVMDTDVAVAKFRAEGIWCEPCRAGTDTDILGDPSLRTRGTVYSAHHPQFGEVKGVGRLFQLSKSRSRPRGETASKGEHTRELLMELGIGAEQIQSLYDRGIVA